MVFALLRVSVDFVKYIRVGKECAEAGIGAEIDHPATIFGARKICGVGLPENPPAQGDETGLLFIFQKRFLYTVRARGRSLHDFRDEDFEGADRQFARRFCCQQPLGAGKQNIQVVTFDLPHA